MRRLLLQQARLRPPAAPAAILSSSLPSSSFSSSSSATATLQQRRHKHSAYEASFLRPRKANFEPLSPMSFLERTATLYPRRTAVAYRDMTRTWKEEYVRIKKLASSLYKAGVRPGDTVSMMAPNIPPVFELHFAVPGVRAVINTLNTRLDPPIVAFQLKHGDCRVLITDTEHSETVEAALQLLDQEGVKRPLVIDIVDEHYLGDGKRLGKFEFEEFVAKGDDSFDLQGPEDESEAIALNYTSGTTGDPKGVVTHHRGAYLNSLANALSWGPMPMHCSFLHIVPMFHCNGWCFPWVITLLAGTHVCTRWVRADLMYEAMERHRVTHFCGAPIVMNLLLNAHPGHKRDLRGQKITMMTAGAPPPPPLMRALEKETGIKAGTAYGLTESYGPTMLHIPDDEAEYPGLTDQAREGQLQWLSINTGLDGCMVADPDTLLPVPADGETQGEVLLRGNVVMSGYLKNEKATEEAFAGEGWFRTGDLAVQHKNGRIQIKDRSKDVIISGGENISTIEVENVLHSHPSISEAAVVAQPDDKWGEVPCAFVSLKDGHALTEEELIAFARDNLAHYKAPKRIIFGPLAKTSTGKVQKYQLRKQAKETHHHHKHGGKKPQL